MMTTMVATITMMMWFCCGKKGEGVFVLHLTAPVLPLFFSLVDCV